MNHTQLSFNQANSVAQHSNILASGNVSVDPDQISRRKDENRIKKMKMSAYFKKPKIDPFQRRYTANVQPNLTMVNSDLDTSNRAVVKLRLDKTH